MDQRKTVKKWLIWFCAITIMISCTLGLFWVSAVGSTKKSEDQSEAFASSLWEIPSGWTDFSTAERICFENNSDHAGTAYYKPYIDGAEGFRLQFQIYFPDPDMLSMARIVLTAESRYNHYFNFLLSSQNGAVCLDAGFCNNGPWTAPVVPNTGFIQADGNVVLTLEHEQNSSYLKVSMHDSAGNELYSGKASDEAYNGNMFLEKNDLQLQVATIADGNRFRFSDLIIESYPDDGQADPVSAITYWSMPSGWEDSSSDGEVRITSTGASAINIYKPEFIISGDFRLSFVYRPTNTGPTEAVVDIGIPGETAYLRLDLHRNPSGTGYQGAEAVYLCLGEEYSYAWKSLGGSPWNWVDESYKIILDWDASEKRLFISREAVNGGPYTAANRTEIPFPAVSNDNSGPAFFDLCKGKNVSFAINTVNNAPFEISCFTPTGTQSAAAQWTMPEGWCDTSTIDYMGFSAAATVEEENLWRSLISPLQGFDLRYALDFDSAGSGMDLILRLSGYSDRYLCVRGQGNDTQAAASVMYVHGESIWELTEESSVPITDGRSILHLYHKAGSDLLTLSIESADGSVLWQETLEDQRLTADQFYDLSDLSVGFIPQSGETTVSDFAYSPVPRETVPQMFFDLGKGWSSYADDTGELYLVKADGRENEAVYRPSIDGSKGFRIEYDISFLSERLTTTYVKLGVLDGREILFFSRIKGTAGSVYAEGQVYQDGVWSGKILSADAAERKYSGGTVHVTLERQQGSDSLRFCLSTIDGTILMDETIRHKVLSVGILNDPNLRFMIGRDSDSNGFRISNISIETYPAVAVAVDALEISGESRAEVGDTLQLNADVYPGNAIVCKYEWILDGVFVSADAAIRLCFEEVGEHILTLSVTDCEGNRFTTSMTLIIVPVCAGIGDVNMDGLINALDAGEILAHVAGVRSLSEEQLSLADQDRDGEITCMDAQRILDMLEEEK